MTSFCFRMAFREHFSPTESIPKVEDTPKSSVEKGHLYKCFQTRSLSRTWEGMFIHIFEFIPGTPNNEF